MFRKPERKVVAGSATATVVAFIMSWVTMVWHSMPDTLSQPLAAAVAAAVTGFFTYVLAWLAKHTNRSDADAAQGPHVS